MAVTYRAIERYSARRLPPLPSESAGLKQVNHIICRAASYHFARLKSLINTDLNLFGTVRLWLTNLLLVAYFTLVPYHLLSAVLKWTVRWLLTYYYSSRKGIRCVTFDNDANRNHKGHSSSWAFSVYLVDSGGTSPTQLLQSIIDCVKDQPALKLVRKAEAFGWIHLWKIPEPSTLPMTVQELPPVWKHQLVTEDSVHEYVSEVYQRPDGIETDTQRPPWRVYLIPLALADDPDKVFSSTSNCCLLVRCHRLLCNPLDSLVREALDKRWIERDGPAPSRVSKSFDTPQRAVVTGSGCVHVSWTHPIPSIDFIDRICLLTGATSAQVVLAALCQSINQCCKQSATSAAILQVEMTAGSSHDYYTLPLGSASLEDGQFVLKTLERQLEKPSQSYRTIPAHSCFPLHRMAAQTNVLSVQMDVVDSSKSLPGISGSFFQWTAFPTPLIPIRLCLWTGDSTIRLGLIQHHQLLFPVKADDVERRIHQLAAGLGVQNRRPLSPHSSPSSSPHRLTPPPTPRL
ncbi:uncharacterized protein LOC130688248 [Daphnia carinata]|uniref:uncharacterized protein LOC130688248 n=1 Tax=Daphnia carinata TaxID=120202 RepID=UPI002868EFC5|nr:uncharacterized protein LOC130688248 [Daphnia carinata]